MKNEIIEILLVVKNKITDNSDMDWTSFKSPDELRKEIDSFITRVNEGDKKVYNDIYVHFLPASTFQDHAIQNSWNVEYLKLAEQFDGIY